MTPVDPARIAPFFHNYISLVGTVDLTAALQRHEEEILSLLRSLPDDKWDYRYAEGKWTVKEVVQHLIDAERIFAYRALCLSRGEQAPLPGFDENAYVPASEASRRTKEELQAELAAVQRATILLYRSFSEEQLERSGTVNGNAAYVRAIVWVTVGHVLHHKKILEERYLA